MHARWVRVAQKLAVAWRRCTMVFRVFGRTVRLAKRLTVPAASFGTGYAYCWAQGREETAPQIIASGVTASWTGLMRGVRQLGRLIPDGGDRLREVLAQVEATELQLLRRTTGPLIENGLDSKLLRCVILRQLCLCAQEDISGSAVQGLVEGADGSVASSGLAELAAFIDVSAAHVAGTASADELAAGGGGAAHGLLQPLAAALHCIVEHGGSSWHKELDCLGVLHVARATAIASSWLAVSQRSASSGAASASTSLLSSEEEMEIVSDLTAVWQALAQPGAYDFIRSSSRARRSPEAAALHADLEQWYVALQAAPQPPPASASRPAKEYVPQKLRGCMMNVMRSSAVPLATAAAATPSATATPIAASQGLWWKLGRLLEYAAWGVLMGGAIVAISADGVGIFRFHVVPDTWRAPLQAIIQQRAVRVEELLAKYDPPENLPPSDLDTVGPWNAQPTYIQPNFHGAPSQQS